MSSDDGIYILRTLWPASARAEFKKFEYRVAYCICIDNLWWAPPWDSHCDSTIFPNGTSIRDGSYAHLPVMWRMFHESKLYWSLNQAQQAAKALLKGYRAQDTPCEYGVSELTYDGVFPTPFMVANTVGQWLRQTLQKVATRDDTPVLKKELKDFSLALADFTAILPYLFSNEPSVPSSEE